MTLSLNQFAPNAQVAGLFVYQANQPMPHNLIVSSNQATAIVAGAIITLDTSSTNKNCPEIKQAAVNDPIYGVIPYNPTVKGNSYVAGDKCAAAKDGDVVWLPAAGSVAVGATLYFNSSNKVTSSATPGNSIVGIALTPASAANDLIQVELHFATTSA